MKSVYSDQKDCCGCSLCAYVCPKNAISIELKDGFYYPEIDQALCVDCGLCRKKCSFIAEEQPKSACLAAYAAKHSPEVIENSSSGGVFTALSDYILQAGGVIFGADFDDEMNVLHLAAGDAAARDRMRGAKYVQSNTAGVFSQLKEYLEKGALVLFTGTPCQASAVRQAFSKYENLYVVDIICHGVPSPAVWTQYVAYIEKKYGKKLRYYKFRDKTAGWRQYAANLSFEDGSALPHNNVTGSFIELFRYDVCLRPSCTGCPYTSMDRVGDLTISDFWGIENVLPEISDNKGVSAVMVNTEKGKRLLGKASSDLQLFPCTQEDIAARQPNLSKPSAFSNKAEAFQKDLKALSFDKILKKYTRVGVKRRGIDLIKSVLKR